MGRPKLHPSKKERIKAYRLKNREHLNEKARIYHKRHRDKYRTERGKRCLENKELLKEGKRRCLRCAEIKVITWFYAGASSCKNCDKLKYKKKPRKILSPETKKLRNCISTHIRISLRGVKGRQKWETLVGYTTKDLMAHLESKFKPGMSWANQGSAWHIDHIIPVSAFNFTSPADLDFKRCWALSNLQPLWARDNIRKNAKLSKPFQPCLAMAV